MKIIITALRRNDTGEVLVPPVPVDVTALFEVQPNGLVVSRKLRFSDVAPYWRGLLDSLRGCALTPDGEFDVELSTLISYETTSGPRLVPQPTVNLPRSTVETRPLEHPSLAIPTNTESWWKQPQPSTMSHGSGKRKKGKRK